MGKPASIKTTEEVRDRPRVLAAERGTAVTELPRDPAAREHAAAEREQRAREAARELGIEHTEPVRRAGRDAWAAIRAHQGTGTA
ncbi:hypothetical protein ACH4PU_15740 [Streptomyces sp. NPDC021100]|uniref:hypothetical protein n=1 Tax=Streptomyces sp. NPDC021100 TaxID=3365114 RepID=UPI0037AE9C7E